VPPAAVIAAVVAVDRRKRPNSGADDSGNAGFGISSDAPKANPTLPRRALALSSVRRRVQKALAAELQSAGWRFALPRALLGQRLAAVLKGSQEVVPPD